MFITLSTLGTIRDVKSVLISGLGGHLVIKSGICSETTLENAFPLKNLSPAKSISTTTEGVKGLFLWQIIFVC